MIGPGAIMLSLSIGSGEWLMGPAAAVQYGPMLMWITTIACVTQTFFNLECIRYAAYCGEPMMIGYNRLKPGKGLWGPIWIITCVVCIGPGWAITSATAWSAILLNRMPGAADKGYVMVWGIVLTAIVLFMLLWGRKVENTLGEDLLGNRCFYRRFPCDSYHWFCPWRSYMEYNKRFLHVRGHS